MCDIIIKETNRKAKSVYLDWNTANAGREPRVWKELTSKEFDGHLGILNCGIISFK